ncbi:MAG: PqqD family protein [Lactovum sp.]
MPKQTELNLTEVYEYRPSVVFDEVEGFVRVIKEQNHWSQRYLRKLHFKIPEKSYRTLDAYGSFIFKQIDGKKNIQELGQLLEKEYEEASDQLYERLVIYLEHLELNEKWIQKREE